MGILRIDCGIIDVWWQSVWGDSDIMMQEVPDPPIAAVDDVMGRVGGPPQIQ